MVFCNIHTHHPPQSQEDITIVNRIVKENIEETSARFQSVGIHPWYIYNVREQIDQLKDIASLSSVVAIGEAGLDKLTETPFEIQQEAFILQAKLAEDLHKPLIIHCVKAWTELIAIRKQLSPNVPWIIHGFRGKGELAEQLIKLGFFLSFGEYYNNKAFEAAWPKHIFTETDDKDIDINTVYNRIASSLQLNLNEFATQVRENVHTVFSV